MGVVVRFGKVKALLREGQWRSADPRLEHTLNRATEDWIQATGGPPVDVRNPDHKVAQEICQRRGGKILLTSTGVSKAAFRSYMMRRQMNFEFDD